MLVSLASLIQNLPAVILAHADYALSKERILVDDVVFQPRKKDSSITFENGTLSISDYEVSKSAVASGQTISASFTTPDTVFIIGPSGTGKTTFLNRISQTLGEKTVAYSKVDDYLFEGSVLDNLILNDAEDVVTAETILSEIGLDSLTLESQLGIGKNKIELSGGERTRVFTARALLTDKPILLLDEPFAGLDEATMLKMGKVIEKYSKNRLVILVAHEALAQKNGQHEVIEFLGR
jgi:ABC-type transport system involved in cytochrome bd biosynthesis fused ATPase/permease subunit